MSSGPYTVYPDPADNPYMIGIPCPYCGVGEHDRCVTSGGNVYGELCHKRRRIAAREAGLNLTAVKPVVARQIEADPETDPDIPDKVSALKLAFWYIEKVGGAKRARVYFEAAAAIAALPTDDE